MKIDAHEFKEVLIFNNRSYKDSRGSFEESFRLDKINQPVNREICFCHRIFIGSIDVIKHKRQIEFFF